MPLDTKYKTLIESGVLLGSAIILAIIISLSLSSFLGNSRMPNVAVSTGSMIPVYNGFQDSNLPPNNEIYPFRGDILLVKKVTIDSLQVGDVIVFDTPSVSEPVVHRIVAKWHNGSEYFFKTFGDNRNEPDGWIVEGNAVIGLVVLRIPHIGWFLLALQSTSGKISVLLLAAWLLLGEEILKLLGLKEEEENTEKQESPQEKKNGASSSVFKKFKLSVRRHFNKREIFFTSIFLVIIFTFITSNLVGGFTHQPSLNCYDRTSSTSLLESRSDNLLTLTPVDSWIEGDSDLIYFYLIRISIQSGGLFNNVDHFEIRVNQTEGLYRWTIHYNYIGTKTIEGAIISRINGTVDVSIHLFSRGWFASGPQVYSFPLILKR